MQRAPLACTSWGCTSPRFGPALLGNILCPIPDVSQALTIACFRCYLQPPDNLTHVVVPGAPGFKSSLGHGDCSRNPATRL